MTMEHKTLSLCLKICRNMNSLKRHVICMLFHHYIMKVTRTKLHCKIWFLDFGYNWSQILLLEAYFIKKYDPVINHGLKTSIELLLFNWYEFLNFNFWFILNFFMITFQLLDLYILLLNNFFLILARLQCRYYVEI